MRAPSSETKPLVNPLAGPLVALGVAFALRAALPVAAWLATGGVTAFHTDDSPSYLSDALALLPARWGGSGAPMSIIRTPGYPLFLLPGLLAGAPEVVTIALQIVLSCLTVWLVFQISLAVFGDRRFALVGAWLCAVEPVSILYASYLMTETLFAFLIALFLFVLLQWLKDQSFASLLCSAGALAASVYVRPVAIFLPLVMAMIVWGAMFVRRGARAAFAHTALFLLATAALTGAWTVRNGVQTGYWGFSAISSKSLYYYHGAATLAAVEGVPYHEMQNRMGYRSEAVYFARHPERRDWPPAKFYGAMSRDGINILRSHPWTFLGIYLRGIAVMFLDSGLTQYMEMFRRYPQPVGLMDVIVGQGIAGGIGAVMKRRPDLFWASLALGLMTAAYLLLAVAGAARARIARNPAAMAVFVVGAYFILISGGPSATPRFRHPIMPAICVFAGAGLLRPRLGLREGEGASDRQ